MTGLGGSGGRVLDSGVVSLLLSVTGRQEADGHGQAGLVLCVCAGTAGRAAAPSLPLVHTDDSSSYP